MCVMVRTTRQVRSIETEARIVAAALRLFFRDGYPETSMEAIAEAAGCSKGGLYHHFKNKHEILLRSTQELAATGALHVFEESQDGAAEWGAFLVDLWAEASRSADLREILRSTALSTAEGMTSFGRAVALARDGVEAQRTGSAAA